MQTEAEKNAEREAYKVEAARAQAVYDNFRYTDAQREQTIEFIAAAMKVIRGEAEFDSLKQLLPVIRTGMGRIPGIDNTSHAFDARFLNQWTGISVSTIPKRDGSPGFEPALFQIDFAPSMNIPRERLEQLLQLKVVHGWSPDGGNLLFEGAPLEGLPDFNGGVFEYSPLKQPQGDFDIEVRFTYLNGPDKDPWTASILTRLHIRRMYLSPEQIKKRNDQKLGHLPQTGERAPKDGRYLAVFADDAMTASVPLDQRTCTYGEGQWMGPAHVWNLVTGQREPMHAWWQWIGLDPLAAELDKLRAADGPGWPGRPRS
jgi:hypothetical protein